MAEEQEEVDENKRIKPRERARGQKTIKMIFLNTLLLDMISTHYMRRHEDVCNVWYMIQFCRKFAKIGGKKRGDNFPQSRIFLPKTIHTSSCKVGTGGPRIS